MRKELFTLMRIPSLVVVSGLLIAQAVGYRAFSAREDTPLMAPLPQFPRTLGSEYKLLQDNDMDAETMRILKPDDYLLRIYQGDDQRSFASLFVAYFRSQRTDRAPHTPQNCLPGHGWVPQNKRTVDIDAGSLPRINANLLQVARGQTKNVVLYWYQTPTRTIANEYHARAQLIFDSIRFHRSDTALVRIVVPVVDESGPEAAEAAATRFAQAAYPILLQHIPVVR